MASDPGFCCFSRGIIKGAIFVVILEIFVLGSRAVHEAHVIEASKSLYSEFWSDDVYQIIFLSNVGGAFVSLLGLLGLLCRKPLLIWILVLYHVLFSTGIAILGGHTVSTVLQSFHNFASTKSDDGHDRTDEGIMFAAGFVGIVSSGFVLLLSHTVWITRLYYRALCYIRETNKKRQLRKSA